jgi:hypothetical protein
MGYCPHRSKDHVSCGTRDGRTLSRRRRLDRHARSSYMEALGISLIAGGLDDTVDVAAIATAAVGASRLASSRHGDPRGLLLDGVIRLVREGLAAGARPLSAALADYRAAVDGHCADGSLSRDGSAARWLSLGVYSAIALWDH